MKKVLTKGTPWILAIVALVFYLQHGGNQDAPHAPQGVPTPTDIVGNSYDKTDAVQKRSRTPIEHEYLVYHSLEEKLDRTRAFAEANGFSEQDMQKLQQALESAFFDPSTKDAFQSRLMDVLKSTYGAEEADFYSGLMNTPDWEQTKQIINSRGAISGQNYDDLRMKMGLIHGRISVDEVLQLVAAGTTLPDDAILKFATAGEVDKIVSLADRNVFSNINYVNLVTGRNALGDVIHRISLRSHNYTPHEAAEAVQKLVSLGVAAMPQNGSFDPMDYALRRVSPNNVGVRLAMISVLLQQGVPFEESHRQAIEAIPPGKTRDKFLELFANYM